MNIILIFLFPNFLVFAEDRVDQLTREVIELRHEVEILNEKYENRKTELQSELKGVTAQKAELESNIRSERVRQTQLNDKLESLQKNIKKISVLGSELTPLFLKNIQNLRDYIKSAVPFKLDERMAAVNNLEEKFKAEQIPPVKALAQLWSLVEDERRLAKENAVYRQTVQLGEQTYLADVAKLGLSLMYFQTDEGRVGQVVKSGEKWSFKEIKDQNGKKMIIDLFSDIKKQIRTGYFILPVQS